MKLNRKTAGSKFPWHMKTFSKQYIALPLQTDKNCEGWQHLLLLGMGGKLNYHAWLVRKWIASEITGLSMHIHGVRDWIQGLAYGRQVLYHWEVLMEYILKWPMKSKNTWTLWPTNASSEHLCYQNESNST
jgi:hypothetical protein